MGLTPLAVITCSAGKRKSAVQAIMCGATLLVTVAGYCGDFPDNVEKINLSREYAIKMAVLKNIDLRVESLNSQMAETDVARSRSIYDTILSVSSTGGVSYIPGSPFFQTTNSTSSIGLTRYLPTGGSVVASTQTGYTNAETEPIGVGSTSEWQSSAGVTISHPLLKNAGRETMELSITLAANTLQDSLERLRSVNTDTVAAVISSYNRLYSLRKNLESRVAALQTAQDFLEALKKRKKQGALQRLEIANTEYAITQRRKDLVDAERNVRDQEAALRYLIGMETKARLILLDAPSREEPKESEEQALKSALELRSELKQLRLTLKSSQLQERVSKHQTLPDLSLTASGGFSGVGPDFGNSYRQIGDRPSRFWSAGLQFTAPLGNTAAENDYRKSKIRTEQVQQQIKALSWRIRNDVESDMRALISARLQIQTADRSLQYAEQRLEEYRKNNGLGTVTVQDVLNAENDLTNARNAQMDALEAFSNAVIKLWKDSGVLLDRQGVHIETANQGPTYENKM